MEIRIDLSEVDFTPVEAAAENARRDGQRKEAAAVIRTARDSMPFESGPAPRGEPPHSHTGSLRRSLAWSERSDGSMVFGPRSSEVGERGMVLEFAGTFDVDSARDEQGRFLRGHGTKNAPAGTAWAHPFMRPAIEKRGNDFAGFVAGSFSE